MTKRNRLQRRSSRQFFPETSLARWVLCGRFASKKCDLHGRNSRHFFLRPLLVCFCGSTLYGVHGTNCYDFSSERFHFRLILRSFWGPKWSYGLIPSFWDQSGINLGSRRPSRPKFHHLEPPVFGPFLVFFSTSFHFCMHICEILNSNFRVCAQVDF